MVDLITLGICILAKRAVVGAIVGSILGAIIFVKVKDVKISGFVVSIPTILYIIVGFGIDVC